MNINDFIFSKRPLTRYLRHIAFWTARFAYWLFNTSLNQQKHPQGFQNWTELINPALLETAREMAITYAIVYWLFPVYLKKKKYFSFTLLTTLVLGIVFWFSFRNAHPMHVAELQPQGFFKIWYHFLYFTGFTIPACIIFIAIRLFKTHYERLEERETLSREKANAEFQLLKAQVHPHFLFNTLNNIYSFALNKSPKASELVSELSGLMRYMINDCEVNLMPLDRELTMLKDYISLEKVRYGDRLAIQVEITGDYSNKKIAPLLMIPFVENCFKHGTSQVLEQPWVKMQIFTQGRTLDFKLSNSKPSSAGSLNGKNGIGLKNIQKRLELLYHSQFELNIDTTPDTFSVHMMVPLEEENSGMQNNFQ